MEKLSKRANFLFRSHDQENLSIEDRIFQIQISVQTSQTKIIVK